MREQVQIRFATPGDCKSIQAIYSHYVLRTAVSFEYEVPAVDEMETRMHNIRQKYPYLVAEAGGEIVGYAYATDFRYRTAYQWSPESTIYLSVDARGKGIGKMLYQKLFAVLRLQGFYNVFAGVALPNEASVALHVKCGFEEIGTYRNIGFKHQAWHSTQWFQLVLDEHPENPQPPRKISELQEEELRRLLDTHSR